MTPVDWRLVVARAPSVVHVELTAPIDRRRLRTPAEKRAIARAYIDGTMPVRVILQRWHVSHKTMRRYASEASS